MNAFNKHTVYADADTTDMIRDIQKFHEKFGLEYSGPPRLLPPDLALFRTKFMQEECNEYQHAWSHVITSADERALQLDALVDLVYVALGTAYLHGFNFAEAWRRVHAANLRKVRCEWAEDSTRGSTHDVIKSSGWTPPDLSDLV